MVRRSTRAHGLLLAVIAIALFCSTATAQAAVTVSTATPAANAVVKGNVSWTASASSPDGIKQVVFTIDNAKTWLEGAAPYVYNGDGATWNTTTATDGTHQLKVVATSKTGEVATQVINVTVKNGSTPTPTGPTGPPTPTGPTGPPTPTPPPPTGSGAVASDFSHVRVSWPTNAGTTAQVYRDGALMASRPVSTGVYTDSMLWYSTAYSYTVKAVDSSGAVKATYGPWSAKTPALPSSGYPASFAGNSIWTGAIPAGSALHPRNAQFMSYFNAHTTNPNMTLRSYGVPIYQAEANDPTYGPFSCIYGCNINANGKVPIPANAVADPGTDHHMTVLSADAKTSWDYYKPVRNSSGNWASTSAGVIIPMNGNGIVPKTLAGANAANMAGLAGLIRPEEIAQGRIDHAVLLGIPGIPSGAPACPATHNVGTTSDPNAIPEGARFQLDPSLNVDALAIPAWQKTVAKAMQKYGAYNRDNSGTLAVYAEASSPSVGGRHYDGWNKTNQGFTTTGGSQGFSSAFPWSKLRVLNFKNGPDC